MGVLLAHRPGVHLQQWQEAEASTWRGPAWNKVLWRSLWWHPSLWQLLLQQPAFQQQQWFQQQLPGPERKHPRRLPAQRQHGEDVVLHHWVEQQLRRPADLEEVSKQPLVLHGLQQPRTMRNVNSVII